MNNSVFDITVFVEILCRNDSPFGYCSTGSVDNCSNPLDDGRKHWFSMKVSLHNFCKEKKRKHFVNLLSYYLCFLISRLKVRFNSINYNNFLQFLVFLYGKIDGQILPSLE